MARFVLINMLKVSVFSHKNKNNRAYYSYCIDATSAQMVYAELVKKFNFS